MFPELFTDGYKTGHRRQYPDFTTLVFDNATPRSSRRGEDTPKEIVYVGGQMWAIKYLINEWNEKFFNAPKDKVVKRFTRYMNSYLGKKNTVGIDHIEALHDLGYLPIKVMSLPEGAVVPLKVPPLVLWNTRPEFFWLPNYLETIMSTSIWGPCTSATTARLYRKLLEGYAMETVGNTGFVPFQGHDFSFRGMMGLEAACMSGFGHLTSFVGTDTIPALMFAEEYYFANIDNELVGCSVNATEHAVMCAGKKESEYNTFLRLIEEVYPEDILAIVSDTWDFWSVLNPAGGILTQLREKIINRAGKVVVRPDSGDPVKIVLGEAHPVATNAGAVELQKLYSMGVTTVRRGNQYYSVIPGTQGIGLKEIPSDEVTPVMKGAIQCLFEIFGGKTNAKGYKELDEHIGLIYGDSITLQRAKDICEGLKIMGFASTNIVFGIGSYTYAYVTRDTDGWAVKATFCVVAGEDREIFKDPATGDGSKKSATGLTAVFKDDKGKYYLKDKATWDDILNCEFKPLFENGQLQSHYTLEEIRARIKTHDQTTTI